MTPELPADLREAIALGIARGYYTHTCVEEIAPLIVAALARARAEGAREALTAAADDLDVMFNEWAEEDHWSPADALVGIEYAESRVRARAAASSGVAPDSYQVVLPAPPCIQCGEPMSAHNGLAWCPPLTKRSGVAPADQPADGGSDE